MIEDVRDKSKILISTAATEHPLWSSDEVLAFRLVHNVIGHCAGGGDWGWKGENLATAAHMSVLDPIAQKADAEAVAVHDPLVPHQHRRQEETELPVGRIQGGVTATIRGLG